MTRTPDPQRPQLPAYDDLRKGRWLVGNIVLSLGVIFFFILAVYWLLSDISGEYQMQTVRSAVRLSLVRKPANLSGELTFGPEAMLVLKSTQIPRDESVNLVFETPDELVARGKKRRRVAFVGEIKDGIMAGEFQEGKRRMKARLERRGINSLCRQIQSHLP